MVALPFFPTDSSHDQASHSKKASPCESHHPGNLHSNTQHVKKRRVLLGSGDGSPDFLLSMFFMLLPQ